MSETVSYEQFEEGGEASALQQSDADLRRLSDVPMEASVEIGRTAMTVGETLDLHAGSIVILDRLAGEPVDLMVNGTLIARGEVVVVDEQFGMRITAIVEGEISTMPPPSESAGEGYVEEAYVVVDDADGSGGDRPAEAGDTVLEAVEETAQEGEGA